MGLLFDGTQRNEGSVSDAAALRLTTWTAELDARLETHPAAATAVAILGKGALSAAGQQAAYWMAYGDFGAGFVLRHGFVHTDGTTLVYSDTAVTLLAGEWYHIGASYDDATDTLVALVYRRGPFAGTIITSSNVHAGKSPYASTEPIRFGIAADGSGGTTHAGRISVSEVRLWSVAKTSAQMIAALGERLVGNDSGLVGYWRCDDGQPATVAYDRSRGNGRNLTPRNRATWVDCAPDLNYPRGRVTTGLLGWHSATLRPKASIAASDAAAAYPVTNLRDVRQALATRTAGVAGTKTWTVGFGQPVTLWALSIHGHNLTSAATILVELHTADSWGAPAVSEVVTVHPRNLVHVFARPWQYLWARLSVTDAANADGYLKLGTLHYWHAEMIHRPASLAAEEWSTEDPSVAVEMPHGQRVTRSVPRFRTVSLSWPALARGHAEAMWDALTTAGEGGPVLVVPDVRHGLYGGSVYGLLTSGGAMKASERSHTFRAIEGVQVREDHP